MSDEVVANETAQHESTTASTKMETSGQGMIRMVAAMELSAQAVTDRSTSLYLK